MKIGLHLPSGQAGAHADGILEVARAAERLGYESAWMFDHLFTPTGLESRYPYTSSGDYPMSASDPFFDPLGVMGVLAGATERIKLGTGVLIPAYRNPIVLGKVVASIENFAPGRLFLGIGTGWMREEFDAVGVDYRRRGRRLDEYIAALRAVWSGEPSAFAGEFYSWEEAGFLPAPTSSIPLIVGGHSDAALRRAARLGDGWAVVTAPGQGSGLDGIAGRIEVLRSYLEEEGRRDPTGFELLLQHVLWFSDAPNRRLPFTGPPDTIAAALARCAELGITMVDLIVYGPPQVIVEAAERFAAEVRSSL